MKRIFFWVITLVSFALLAGCTPVSGGGNAGETVASKRDNIPFEEGQAYAVAHLGYLEIEDLDYYVERYLDGDQLPTHYFSYGDYYLVIPRYSGMELSLYRNDITTSDATLVYEEPDCRSFIIQCNVSDIFPDATIQLRYEGTAVEFSPFISLKDGSVVVGEKGLNITKHEGDGA